jgi:broad specificity phosphatase PhoE
MKKYLILVKHSLPELVEGLPAYHWKLSKEGRERAKRLAEELTNFEPEVIVSSSEPKAKETAEILAEYHHLELHIAEDLHEHDRSNVAFLSRDQFQSSVREYFQKPDMLIFGKETAHQSYTRFYRAVHFILNEHKDKTIVIVSHGTVISLFVSRLTGSPDFELWTMLGLPSFVALDLHSNTVIVRDKIV